MPVFVKEMDFPSAFGFVPWRYHVEIVTKSKTIEESWSRRVLIDNMQEYKRMVSVVKEEGEEVTAFRKKPICPIRGVLALIQNTSGNRLLIE